MMISTKQRFIDAVLKQVLSRAFWLQSMLPIGILALAFVTRLPWLAFPGFGHDPQYYGVWSQFAETHFFHIYSASVQLAGPHHHLVPGSYANYPPGMMILLLIIRLGYQCVVAIGTGQPLLQVPFDTASGAALVTLKTIFVLADMFTAWLIYHYVRLRAFYGIALVAMCVYAFSPAVIYDAGVWGQADGLVSLFIMGTLWLLYQQRPLLACGVLAFTILIKAQMLVLVPLFLIWLYFSYGKTVVVRCAALIAGVVVVLLGPFLLFQTPNGQGSELQEFISNVLYIQHLNNFQSYSAYNLWWLFGHHLQHADLPVLGPLSANTVGLLLFALSFGFVTLCVWLLPRLDVLLGGLAIIAFAFFFVTTTQHERYLFPALLPLVIWRPQSPRVLIAAIVCQFTVFLNVFITHPLPQPLLPDWFVPAQWPPNLPFIVAWTNVLLFLYLFVEMGLSLAASQKVRSQKSNPTRLLPRGKRTIDIPSLVTKRLPDMALPDIAQRATAPLPMGEPSEVQSD